MFYIDLVTCHYSCFGIMGSVDYIIREIVEYITTVVILMINCFADIFPQT